MPTWGIRERPESTYFPIPWLLSTAGYGVLVDNPETSYFRVRSDSASDWSVEVVRAPEGELGGELAAPSRHAEVALLRRPRSRRRGAPVHPRDRPPAAAAGAVAVRTVVPAGQPSRRDRRPPRRRRPGLGRPDLSPLPALRRPPGCRGAAAGLHRRRPRPRGRDHHLLQPDGLRELYGGLRPRRGRRRPRPRPRRRSLPLRLRRRPGRAAPRRPVRLLPPGRPRPLRAPAPGGDRARLRRLDGGLRRVHAARLGPGRGRGGDRRHPRAQPLRHPLPLRRLRRGSVRPPADRPLPALGVDRRRSVRDGGLGRRPDDRLGLRRARLGGHPVAQHGPLGDQRLGNRHRRLLRARVQRARRRAAQALGPVRRSQRGDADPAQRRRAAASGPPPGERPRSDRELAPLREAAHPALPLSRRGPVRVRGGRHAADAPHGARVPRRSGPGRTRRPVPLRRRPARGTRRHPGCDLARGRGPGGDLDRPLALGLLRAGERRARARRRRRRFPTAAPRRCPRR